MANSKYKLQTNKILNKIMDIIEEDSDQEIEDLEENIENLNDS